MARNRHIFLLFFGRALGATSGRLRMDSGPILTPFGLHFGVFWEPLRKVKIELSLKRQPHFHCPRESENRCFFELLSERPPEHPLEPLLGLFGSIWARFWGPLATPVSLIFLTLFRSRFGTTKTPELGPKRAGCEGGGFL